MLISFISLFLGQVQTFDPFKEEAEAEQMRLEELKLQKQAEKEEKVRVPHHGTVFCSMQRIRSTDATHCSSG